MEIKDYQAPAEKKEPERAKEIKPVVQAKGARKRNPIVKSLISVEDAYDLKQYAKSVLKQAFVDMIKNGIDIVAYGPNGNPAKKSKGSRVSYRSYYDDDVRDRREPMRYRANDFDFDDIIFDNRGDAQMVLDNMFDILERYKVVTVADYYDLCGERCSHTANKFGWTSLGAASISRIRDGYVIRLPRALAID